MELIPILDAISDPLYSEWRNRLIAFFPGRQGLFPLDQIGSTLYGIHSEMRVRTYDLY